MSVTFLGGGAVFWSALKAIGSIAATLLTFYLILEERLYKYRNRPKINFEIIKEEDSLGNPNYKINKNIFFNLVVRNEGHFTAKDIEVTFSKFDINSEFSNEQRLNDIRYLKENTKKIFNIKYSDHPANIWQNNSEQIHTHVEDFHFEMMISGENISPIIKKIQVKDTVDPKKVSVNIL